MTDDKIKKNKREWLIAIIIGFVFVVINILLVRNEVFMDDWYIESSADGLFGKDNISYFTVGANFLFLWLIHLASLTGIRLSWIHVFMLIMNMISSILVCKVIFTRVLGMKKYLLSIFVLLLIMPYVCFYMQFTLTASYVVIAGCMWIFCSIIEHKSKSSYFFGELWTILGALMRFDAIYYAVIFMGSIVLIQIIKIVITSIKEKKKYDVVRPIIRIVIPFLIPLVIIVGIEIVNRMAINIKYPGFSEWNSTRAHVDDYEIPDYDECSEQYKAIGVSYNDYQLLKSWNNLDDNFYTLDLYNKILNMKDKAYEKDTEHKQYDVIEITVNMIRSNYALYFIVSALIITIIYNKKIEKTLTIVVLLMDVVGLYIYFVSIRRLIWRTEWPLYISLIVSITTVITCLEREDRDKKIAVNKSIGAFLGGIVFCVIFVPVSNADRSAWNPYNGCSLYQVYFDRFSSNDTYCKYLFDKLNHKDTSQMATIDYDLTDYSNKNKQFLVYHLSENEWMQVNPLTNLDLFRAAPKDVGENFAMLGQYMSKLAPLRNNEERYGIKDRFKDLNSDNVRIACKNKEIKDRAKELQVYLNEHYYNEIDFSITDVFTNTAVGRFISDLDLKENAEEQELQYDVSCDDTFGIPDMICLHVNNLADMDYISEADNYIILKSSSGEKHIFSMVKGINDPCAIIFNDTLKSGEVYDVQWVVKNNDDVKIYNSVNKFYNLKE